MNLPKRIPFNSFVGRLLRLPLKLIPNGTPVPVLTGPNRGRHWIKGYGPNGYWLGTMERALQTIAVKNIRHGDVVYDIGANVGLHTLLFSRLVGEVGRVFAFEPAPDAVLRLREHLRLNQIQNVNVIEKAVAGRAEQRYFSAENLCMGHLDKHGNIAVLATTLDLLIKKLPPPNYIKMDIEGAEIEALTGGEECFRRHRPKLFLATHRNSSQCCEILKCFGYSFEFFEAGDLFARPD